MGNSGVGARSTAVNALPFLKWLMSAEIHLEFAMATGHLPIRQSEVDLAR